MGGWSDKTKLIRISTLVEVVVEVEVELGKRMIDKLGQRQSQTTFSSAFWVQKDFE